MLIANSGVTLANSRKIIIPAVVAVAICCLGPWLITLAGAGLLGLAASLGEFGWLIVPGVILLIVLTWQEHGKRRARGARLTGGRQVSVNGTIYTVGKIIIATGSRPWAPPIPGLKEAGYLDSTDALSLPALPASLLVIGAGAIGLELGQLFNRFGVRVMILEGGPNVAGAEEPEIGRALTEYLEGEKIRVCTGVKINSVERANGEYRVQAEINGQLETCTAEQLMIATGRRPRTSDLGLDEAGVQGGLRRLRRRKPSGRPPKLTPQQQKALLRLLKKGARAAGFRTDPETATCVVEIFAEVGVLSGVLNMILGASEPVGQEIVQHPLVSAISFTGSTTVGLKLYEQVAHRGIKIQCEMGGKNAVVALHDADLSYVQRKP